MLAFSRVHHALFKLAFIFIFSVHALSSPTDTRAMTSNVRERKTETRSTSDVASDSDVPKILFYNLSPSDQYGRDYATFSELRSSISDSNILSAIYQLLQAYYTHAYDFENSQSVNATISFEGVSPSFYGLRVADSDDADFVAWMGAFAEDYYSASYTLNAAYGLFEQLQNADAVETCAVFPDSSGDNVLVVLLLTLGWGDGPYAFRENQEAFEKMYECESAFWSGGN